MASTRNKNTPGNYCLDQRQFTEMRNWSLYENSSHGQAFDTKLAGNGLNPCQMPWTTLSHNPADIESFLFGINSTNLVNPSHNPRPELIRLGTVNLFEKQNIIICNIHGRLSLNSLTRIAVILSVPATSSVFFAHISSNISSTGHK